jgi:hypothetical protein
VPDEDVKDATSSVAGEQAQDQPQTDATVTGAQGDDRPVQNVVAEFNRKFAKTQQQLDTVLQWIASQAVTQQAQPTRQADKTQVSDEDLWALAQQGDRQAFELYQERIADRRIKQESQQQNRTRLVQGQLAALMGRYPVLNNPQHALTQYVNAAYQAYLQNGYPAGQETLLEAAKTAIADRPDLVAAEFNAGATAREGVRRSATQSAQSGVTGVSHRQSSSSATQAKTVTPDQRALAKRMGIKDPGKAIKGFLDRQENGQSSLGGVRAFVNEEEI